MTVHVPQESGGDGPEESGGDVGPEELRQRAVTALTTARDRTELLTSCVADPELTAQHSPLMSPLVWDLAHIGNQEEQWLLRTLGRREALRPDIDSVYDAFEHPRAERPSLPLLPPAEARRYVGDVRARVLDVVAEVPLSGGGPLAEAGFAFGMVAQHEQQHDETMLITHQLRRRGSGGR
ncbi:DinB family protein, partial [Streptomyces sp. GC420]|uniref:DinB family protein n=1 Tax=Streptomyces sp. GC420 TaxID=2697568 RepID=UPI001AA1A551